jgi:hypothetical protein
MLIHNRSRQIDAAYKADCPNVGNPLAKCQAEQQVECKPEWHREPDCEYQPAHGAYPMRRLRNEWTPSRGACNNAQG